VATLPPWCLLGKPTTHHDGVGTHTLGGCFFVQVIADLHSTGWPCKSTPNLLLLTWAAASCVWHVCCGWAGCWRRCMGPSQQPLPHQMLHPHPDLKPGTLPCGPASSGEPWESAGWRCCWRCLVREGDRQLLCGCSGYDSNQVCFSCHAMFAPALLGLLSSLALQFAASGIGL
jgi:hypothetical protein